MEEKFLEALAANREKAAKLGVRIRPVADMKQAKRYLSGSRASDGFDDLVLDQLFVDDRAIDREEHAVHAAHGIPGKAVVAEQHFVDVLAIVPNRP